MLRKLYRRLEHAQVTSFVPVCAGCMPQSNMMVLPRYLSMKHDLPTSCPAPRGIISTVSCPDGTSLRPSPTFRLDPANCSLSKRMPSLLFTFESGRAVAVPDMSSAFFEIRKFRRILAWEKNITISYVFLMTLQHAVVPTNAILKKMNIVILTNHEWPPARVHA